MTIDRDFRAELDALDEGQAVSDAASFDSGRRPEMDAVIAPAVEAFKQKKVEDLSSSALDDEYAQHKTRYDEGQARYRDASERGDAAGITSAMEQIGSASAYLSGAELRRADAKSGTKRIASGDQDRTLDHAIIEQGKRVAYYEDLIENGTKDPSFIPEGQSIQDWRLNLQREKKALATLASGREHGRQVAAPEDAGMFGELARGLTRSTLGTIPEMLGGAAAQVGKTSGSELLTDAGGALRDFGKSTRQGIPAADVNEVFNDDYSVKFGAKRGFFQDLGNYAAGKLGEGLGTSIPIIAGFMLGGAPVAVGGGMALGIGQMRNSLEEEFEKLGVDFPEDKAASYVYAYGSMIGALESATEALGLSGLVGPAKKEAVRSAAKYIAKGVALGTLSESITEGLQELVETYGVSQATDQPIDWVKARKQIVEASIAGGVPGSAFGAYAATTERSATLQEALAKARAMGFSTGEDAPVAKPKAGQGDEPAKASATPDARDVAPSLDGEDPGKGPAVRTSKSSSPDLDQFRSIIEQATPAGSSVSEPATGKPVETKVPSWNDVYQALPKDENGDPDVGKFFVEAEKFGARAWNGLNDDQRRQVYQAIAPVIEQAAPVVEKIAEAIQAGNAGPIVQKIAEAIAAVDEGTAAQEAAGGQSQVMGKDAAPKAPAAPARSSGDLRTDFNAVLNSKAKRSEWATSIGATPEQLDALVREALADGRLKKTKAGGIARTGKKVEVKPAAPAPQAAPQPPADRRPQGPPLNSIDVTVSFDIVEDGSQMTMVMPALEAIAMADRRVKGLELMKRCLGA